MKTTINLDELHIGVFVKDTQTKYFFKDLTEATLFAAENLNKGRTIEMQYCDKYGCKIA